jgi:hypothetical protein
MPYNHEKINQLTGGWYVVLKDGTVHTQQETDWTSIPNKKDIKVMGLKRMNKHYELQDKAAYCPPGETHMKELAIGTQELMVTKDDLVGWYIGHYTDQGKEITRINATDGSIVKEVIPYK